MIWDIIRDAVEVASVVGGGAIITIKFFGKEKADKKMIFQEIDQLRDDVDRLSEAIEKLEKLKLDAKIMDMNTISINKSFTDVQNDVQLIHADMKERMKTLSDNLQNSDERIRVGMEGVNKQLGKVTGTLETLKEFILRK